MTACTHLDQIEVLELPGPIAGCAGAIARSADPGEEWSWCYVDEVAFVARGR